jgi:capsule polysaccharide export protein KpsE/RkpR
MYFDTFASKQRYVQIALPIFAQIILFIGTVYFGIFASSVFVG